MSADKLIAIYFEYQTPIIQALVAFVILTTIGLIVVTFFKSDTGESAGGSPDLKSLEDTLRKIMEQTQRPAVGSGAEAASNEKSGGAIESLPPVGASAAGAATSEDALKLKSSLEEREKKIQELMSELEKMKTSTAAGAPPANSDVVGLEARIKDLEARLQEYEIIEDDIANLSLYKEENTRLKDELAKAKTSTAAAVGQMMAQSESTEAVASSTPETTPNAEELAKDLGIIAEPSVSSATDSATSSGAQDESAELMAEMAAAVASSNGPVSAKPAPTEATAPTKPLSESEPDLVAELAGLMDQQTAATNINTSIAANVPPVASSTTTPSAASTAPAVAVAPATESTDSPFTFDTEKLVEEAGNLKEPDPGVAAAAAEEGDSGEKLIAEFESFMKEST